MSRSLALSMAKPHERFGIPQPIGRRIPHGMTSWNILLVAITIILTVFYIFQVNKAASRSFALREMEKKIETRNTAVVRLEDKVAALSSIQSVSERAKNLGFQPAERIEFVNPAANAYAMVE